MPRIDALRVVAGVVLSLTLGLAAADNIANPSFTSEPGAVMGRSPDGSFGVESIDPFNGVLKIVNNDITVPSNGGLDLTVTRSYNGVSGGQIPGITEGRTATGIAWEIHYGRVWRGSGSLLMANNCATGNVTSKDNPVLELPDGSRQLLVNGDAGQPYVYISHNRWIARCLSSGSGLLVISPEGIQYTFNYGSNVEGTTGFAFHCTRIQHPNGTFITINYVAGINVARISSVQHSEGQRLTFSYDGPTSLNGLLKEISLNSPARTWSYSYALALDTLTEVDYYWLKGVTQPDGNVTAYDYYPQPTTGSNVGSYMLRSITTQLGGVVTYTYRVQAFPLGTIAGGTANATVVDSKTTSAGKAANGIDANGTWTYRFTIANTNAGQTSDLTQVAGPSNCVVYQHQSYPSGLDTLWRIGLLLSKTTRASCTGADLRKETYSWSGQQVARLPYFRPGFLADTATFAPILNSTTIVQDGTTYTSTYSNYDTFGNAQRTVETGQDTRTTDRTFLNDNNQWIIHRVKNETLLSAASTGNYSVVRNFFATGDLRNESRAGVLTSYVWFTSGASRGELNAVTDANNNTVTYTNYKRGTPQNESYPVPGITVARTVSDSGAVSSQTDPRGRQTLYSYDSVDELTGVQTPSTTDDNISIVRAGLTSRRMDRGIQREVRNYDEFGRLRQTVMSDTSSGNFIDQRYQYDAEGRVVRAFLPNGPSYSFNGLAERTEYDALGRVRQLTHTDGTSVVYEYLPGNVVRVRNERGFRTTYTYRSYGDPSAKDLMRIDAETGVSTITTSISRNKLGQVTSVNQGGLTRTYQYDARFLLISETDPELGTIAYGRDAVGNLTSRRVGSSGNTIYTLDSLYRIERIDYPNSTLTPFVDYGYHPDGNFQFIIKGNTRWDYEYDGNDNLTTEQLTVNGRTYRFTNNYDSRDALSSLLYPSGLSVSYAPNALGQATHVSSSLGMHASSISYYPNGQLKSYLSGNGYRTELGQDRRLLPTTLTAGGNLSTGSSTAINLSHQYDEAGNTTSITDMRDATKTRTLGYDGVNRLRTANGPWGNGSYSYDARHNFLSRQLGTDALTYNYNASTGRLNSITGTFPRAFAYDTYGNITSNGTDPTFGTFAYDDSSNLVRVGNGSISYAYDGNSRMAMESWGNNSLQRYTAYTRAGQLMMEDDVVNSEAIDYIYLGSRLLLRRSRCTTTSDADKDGITDCNEWRAQSGLPDRPTFSIGNQVVSEGAGTVTFTVSLQPASTTSLQVSYATSNNSAAAGADFTGQSGSLSFAANQTSQTFSIPITSDTLFEGNEVFTVALSAPSGGARLGNSTASGTIIDDDPAPSLAINDVNVVENVASGVARFTVTKTGGTALTHTVNYVTADITALTASDYSPSSGVLTFAPSETSKTIDILVLNDALTEPAESFRVTLSAPSNGATLGRSFGTATIIDDDPSAASGSLQFTTSAVSISEGGGTHLSISRIGGSSGAASVLCSSSNGTATAGAPGSGDFAAVSTLLTWADGDALSKDCLVTVHTDAVSEGNETFTVSLSGASGATLGTTTSTFITIVDATAPPSFAVSGPTSVSEGNAVTFTISKIGATSQAYSVSYSTADGSARVPGDYTAKSGTLSFAANESSKTIVVATTAESIYETNESFSLSLSAPTNGATLSAGSATVVIDNDDPAPSFLIADQSFDESTGVANIVVTRTGVTELSHSVSYATSDLSALAGQDYTAASGTLALEAYESVKTFPVTLAADASYESNESFRITLSAATSGATLGNSTGTITIVQPLDTSAPTTPTSLAATAVSGTQVNLAWTASTDSGGAGLAGYRVMRGGTQVATTTSTSYADTGLTPGTTYVYSVQAYDGATPANNSSLSNSAGATTVVASVPTTPVNFNAFVPNPSNRIVQMSWFASSGATRYEVYATELGRIYTGTALSASYSGGVAGQFFQFYVVACNANGCSSPSQVIDVEIPCDPLQFACNLNSLAPQDPQIPARELEK